MFMQSSNALKEIGTLHKPGTHRRHSHIIKIGRQYFSASTRDAYCTIPTQDIRNVRMTSRLCTPSIEPQSEASFHSHTRGQPIILSSSTYHRPSLNGLTSNTRAQEDISSSTPFTHIPDAKHPGRTNDWTQFPGTKIHTSIHIGSI